jgi:hypothetical protein
MSHFINLLIMIALTQTETIAHAPGIPVERKVAAEYGAARGLFVVKGATCESSGACLILKASKVNKQFKLNKGVK